MVTEVKKARCSGWSEVYELRHKKYKFGMQTHIDSLYEDVDLLVAIIGQCGQVPVYYRILMVIHAVLINRSLAKNGGCTYIRMHFPIALH